MTANHSPWSPCLPTTNRCRCRCRWSFSSCQTTSHCQSSDQTALGNPWIHWSCRSCRSCPDSWTRGHCLCSTDLLVQTWLGCRRGRPAHDGLSTRVSTNVHFFTAEIDTVASILYPVLYIPLLYCIPYIGLYSVQYICLNDVQQTQGHMMTHVSPATLCAVNCVPRS